MSDLKTNENEHTLELEAGFKSLGEAVEAMLLELRSAQEEPPTAPPALANEGEAINPIGNLIILREHPFWKRARHRPQ